MPLILQALPLSLMTFVHYLLVLPILAVSAFIASYLTFIPIFGLAVPGTIAAFCTMVGLRCALTARGHGNEPDFTALASSSFVFCLINILFTVVVGGILFGLMYLATMVPGRKDYLFEGPGAHYVLEGVVLFVFVALLGLFASAMAVPMTASAKAGTTDGHKVDTFFGFGAGFASLSVLTLAWATIAAYSGIFGELQFAIGLVSDWITAFASGENLPDLRDLTYRQALMALVLVWASSWFFATAVLAWERVVKTREDARLQPTVAARSTSDDFRALREARMRDTSDP
jgi:hypothetical protein